MSSIFRICDRRFDPADPTGATLHPGRWHALGQPVLYFSSSLALAVLEMRANNVPFDLLREEFHYAEIGAPLAAAVEAVSEAMYVPGWAHQVDRSREYGAAWYGKSRSAFLKVSSAALSSEANYVLNTRHAGFGLVRFSAPRALPLDERL